MPIRGVSTHAGCTILSRVRGGFFRCSFCYSILVILAHLAQNWGREMRLLGQSIVETP